MNKSVSGNALRKRVLYSNCFMQAPDGQVLCVCDAKKAQWYCEKDLAGTLTVSAIIMLLTIHHHVALKK